MKKHLSGHSGYLLRRFSTDFNEIWHGRSVRGRECSGGTWIKNFLFVAMEKWNCGLWSPIWPRQNASLPLMSLKVSFINVHKFSEKHGVGKFWPVSMVTANNWFQVVETWKQWSTYWRRSIKNIYNICFNNNESSSVYRTFCPKGIVFIVVC